MATLFKVDTAKPVKIVARPTGRKSDAKSVVQRLYERTPKVIARLAE